MRPALFVEKYSPLASGFVAASLYIAYGLDFFSMAKTRGWNVPAIYSGVFDLASIITAFIFGFFTFARTSETDFLFQMRATTTFKRFMRYLLRAMYSSAAVVLLTMPFLVAEPKPDARHQVWFWLSTIWLSLVTYSAVATVRSIRQFIALAMVEKDPKGTE